MKELKSLKKNAFFSFIKSFMDLIFPLITFPYASRILSPEGIGQINFSNSITSYFAMIAGFGVTLYATREVSRIKDDKEKLNKFCKEILVLNLITTFISYFIFALALIFVNKFSSYKILLILSSSTILFRAISMSWLYTAFEDFKLITLRTTIFQFLSLIFLFTFVKDSSDLIAYMIFGLICPIGTNLFNFIYSFKYINYKYKCHLELKKHLKPIFVFFGMTFITSIYETLDSSMLGFLANDTQVGYYSVAIKINRIVLMLITSISAILLPRLSWYSEKNDTKSFYDLITKALAVNSLISIPCAAGLFILSKPIVLLFSGSQYIPSVNIMKIMTLIIIVISVNNLIGGQVFPSLKKEKLCFYSSLAGALVNLILNAVLIPLYGALGAGIASVAAESVIMIIQIIFFIKVSKESLNFLMIFKNLFQVIVASFIMALAVIFTESLIENLILKLLVSVTSGVFTYAIILALFRNQYFLEIFNKIKSYNIGKNHD